MANSVMNDVFSGEELRKITKSIKDFLYAKTDRQGTLSRTSCMDLIKFLDYVPEAGQLLNFSEKI